MTYTNDIKTDAAAIVREEKDEEVIRILEGFTYEEKLEIISYLQVLLQDRKLFPVVLRSEKV